MPGEKEGEGGGEFDLVVQRTLPGPYFERARGQGGKGAGGGAGGGPVGALLGALNGGGGGGGGEGEEGEVEEKTIFQRYGSSKFLLFLLYSFSGFLQLFFGS